jgi:hypothetical protein
VTKIEGVRRWCDCSGLCRRFVEQKDFKVASDDYDPSACVVIRSFAQTRAILSIDTCVVSVAHVVSGGCTFVRVVQALVPDRML